MANLNNVVSFDDGSITLALFTADGPQIKWWPNDTNFVDRLSRFNAWLDEDFTPRFHRIGGMLRDMELDADGNPIGAPDGYKVGSFEEMGEEFKAKLDEAFDMPVSAIAFEKVNPMSPTPSGGFVCENFLDAIMPFIEKSFDDFKGSRERYTARFKNRAQRRAKKEKA